MHAILDSTAYQALGYTLILRSKVLAGIWQALIRPLARSWLRPPTGSRFRASSPLCAQGSDPGRIRGYPEPSKALALIWLGCFLLHDDRDESATTFRLDSITSLDVPKERVTADRAPMSARQNLI